MVVINFDNEGCLIVDEKEMILIPSPLNDISSLYAKVSVKGGKFSDFSVCNKVKSSPHKISFIITNIYTEPDGVGILCKKLL